MQASAISGAADQAVHDAKPVLEKLARVGFFASGLLYMTIGALATAAALRLGGTELGRWPFAIVAIGLVAYGIYQMINALCRRIEIA